MKSRKRKTKEGKKMFYSHSIYDTPKFSDIWENESAFMTDYAESPMGQPIKGDTARILYDLL